jgi:tol-pal system protein YbgF
MAYLTDQVAALNKRVAKIEKDLDTRMKSTEDSQAAMQVEIDRLRSEIKEQAGRIEDNEHILKRTVERDLGERDTMVVTLSEVNNKVSALEALVNRQQEYLGLEPLTPKPEELQKPEKEPAEEEVLSPGQRAVLNEEAASTELGLYDKSLAAYRVGKYEEAMDGFKTFLEQYPKSDRADNAHFWIGESYMALKQYEQAILAYQNVIKKYPKGNKVPNAMLRQAMAFLEINDKTSSRLLLKKIIKSYPKSSEAGIAKNKLKNL